MVIMGSITGIDIRPEELLTISHPELQSRVSRVVAEHYILDVTAG
jgi:hypothetical protein